MENIRLPKCIKKSHLLLIAEYCNDESLQDRYIQSILDNSWNCSVLQKNLISGIPIVNGCPNIAINFCGISIKKHYDLGPLKINKG